MVSAVVVEMTRITRCSVAVFVCRGGSVVDGMVLEPWRAWTPLFAFGDVARPSSAVRALNKVNGVRHV